MSKPASVQFIKEIKVHPNADSLDLAIVQSWQCCVKKGEFKAGDLVVYIEIDSLCPEKPEFEFLRNKGFKVKTIKLRKEISQGLVMPLSILPPNSYVEEQDVSEILGVKHYEKSVSAVTMGLAKGNFPSYLGWSKTDEENAKSHSRVIEEIQEQEIYITEKRDGSSFSAYFNNGQFGYCSRNLELKLGEDAFSRAAIKYDIQNKLTNLNRNVGLQAELCGPGLNGNKLGLKDIELHIFNVYDFDKKVYLDYDDAKQIAISLDIPFVKEIYRGIFSFDLTYLQRLANDLKYESNGSPIEGIVIRKTKEDFSQALRGRLSFKVISETFLLKYNE